MLESLNTNNLEYQKLTKDEMTKRGILGRLVGACADIINPTRNGRKYSEKLWENVFDDPIMKERIENGVCYGELGHPADREETDMEKIAVCLAEVPKKGSDGKLRAVFDILNTPNGRILKSLCDYGSTLGISSRGSGDLEVDYDGQESVNPDTYNCEGFDIVLIPAVKDARLQYVTESLDKKRYNKTLREKLTESINKETEDHQKIMKESLNTLGIDLNESKMVKKIYTYTNPAPHDNETCEIEIRCPEDKFDYVVDEINKSGIYFSNYTYCDENNNPIGDKHTEIVIYYRGYLLVTRSNSHSCAAYIKVNGKMEHLGVYDSVAEAKRELDWADNHNSIPSAVDESKDAWDNLNTILTEGKLSPEEKMDMWHDGLRRENIKACGDEKLFKYLDICRDKGYDEQCEIIEHELHVRGFASSSLYGKDRVRYIDVDGNEALPGRTLEVRMSKDKSILYILCNEAGASFIDHVIHDIDWGEEGWEDVDAWEYDESTDEFVIHKDAPKADEIADLLFQELEEQESQANKSQTNESLNEARFGSYNYVYGIHARPNGKDILLAGAHTLDDAARLGIEQIQSVMENPFMSNKEKYAYLDSMYIVNADTEETVTSDFDNAIDDFMSELSTKLDECNSQTNETYINEEDEAGDVDTALIDELQEALKLNKKLDEKIVNLQKQVSASNAKEIELNEEIDSLKIKVVKLSDKAKSNIALTEKLSKLERDLQESTEAVQTKKTALRETIDRDAKERKTLQESIESKDNEIAKLQKQLTEANKKVSVTDKDVKALNEQLDTAHKDARQLKEKYSKKLEEKDVLIEKYKKIAKTAVDNYISSKATVLGVSTNEIKNRLPESYSFKDINEVCDSLREYNINMNSLPFTTNKLNEGINVAVKNADTRTLIKNEDDEISDADMKLAEKFMRK